MSLVIFNQRRFNFHREGNEGALLDIKSGEYLQLNPTGTFILDMIINGKDESHIINTLAESFHIPLSTADTDYKMFLKSLRKLRVIIADKSK